MFKHSLQIAVLLLISSSKSVIAADEFRPIPTGFKLQSVIQGASTIAPFDMSVATTDTEVAFNWRAVCFPKCAPNLKIDALKSFLVILE